MSKRLSFEDSIKNVVLSGECTGCAACVTTCPSRCLDYMNGKPNLISSCNVCGVCSSVCPRYDTTAELEEFVFGRKKDVSESFGVFQEIFVARAKDENILNVCQDGGVVSALLTCLLKNDSVQGAIVSGVDDHKPLFPRPLLITAVTEVLHSSGTRYSYSPNLLALRGKVGIGMKKLALVGTPCQIAAARRIQMKSLKNVTGKIVLTIGLLCSGALTYKTFVEEYLTRKLKVDPNDVVKMNIKGKLIITLRSGKAVYAPLKDLQPYFRTNCNTCNDFSAELSDISVGGLGLDGWTLTIIRTETGKKTVAQAVKQGFLETKPVDEKSHLLDLLTRLSKKKKSKIV